MRYILLAVWVLPAFQMLLAKEQGELKVWFLGAAASTLNPGYLPTSQSLTPATGLNGQEWPF